MVKYYPGSASSVSEQSQDSISDRVDVSALSWVSSLSSALPSVLNTLVLPALAAGSAVWISNNIPSLPTPVEHQRAGRGRRGAPGHHEHNIASY